MQSHPLASHESWLVIAARTAALAAGLAIAALIVPWIARPLGHIGREYDALIVVSVLSPLRQVTVCSTGEIASGEGEAHGHNTSSRSRIARKQASR